MGAGIMRCPICGEEMGVDDNIVIFRGEAETIVDLPADLQNVYNVLHLTEKQFEVLDNFLEKALIALANQAKYEKALQLMAEHSLCATAYGNNCDVCDCENPNIRNKCMSQYINDFKQQAGLEV